MALPDKDIGSYIHGKWRAKYEPEQNAIVWRIKCFPGKAKCMLSADLELVRTVRPKTTRNVGQDLATLTRVGDMSATCRRHNRLSGS
jgi:hypothetical protein